MASVIIREDKEDRESAEIVLTQSEFSYGNLVKNHLVDYNGLFGKVIYCAFERPEQETTFDAVIKLKIQWSKTYQENDQRFHLLMADILKSIQHVFVSLKSQFIQQAKTYAF